MDADLQSFEITADRGFLPAEDPIAKLPDSFSALDDLGQELPKLLVSDQLPAALEDLPPLDVDALHSDAELNRAMLILSYAGHASVWGGAKPNPRIPRSIAVPWMAVARCLGRPPVLSYASYALHNWKRIDPDRSVELGNIALRQNFLGGADEEWFILVHVDIEAKAAPAIRSIRPAQTAAAREDLPALADHLAAIASSLREMHAALLRMPECCDPYIYFHRVRPYIFGWKDQPALPDGVTYDGVAGYDGPQKFRGETGAQSAIIPSLDAALGVGHSNDRLHAYLTEMRDYMPPRHRAFIEAIEQGPSIRDVVVARHSEHAPLREAYNECVHYLGEFRGKHLEYAGRYIHSQSQSSASNPNEVGTAGTPFMEYLKKHLDETASHLVR
jgi:indoleamine 2,3-dioxygenase